MNTNNADKSSSWKNWIIKKLLSNDSTKEDILNFIANDEDNKNIDDLNAVSYTHLTLPTKRIV